MEDLLLFLIQQGLIDGNARVVPIDIGSLGFLGGESSSVRVRQIIPYVLEDLVGVKKALPQKVFTEKYPPVKYPYSVIKKKQYSQLGLEMEELVLWKLSTIYLPASTQKKQPTLQCLTEKERISHLDDVLETVEAVGKFFVDAYPAKSIHKIATGVEFSHQSVSGHPDLVVYLTPKRVAIFDVKVFGAMNVTKAREIKAQLSLYVALARSQGLECHEVGVIMPWKRNPPVVRYDVKGWTSDHLLKLAEECAEKVNREPATHMKWCDLLNHYQVGSHVHKDDALRLLSTKTATQRPFQIFLYGNNPSPERERAARKEWESVPAGAFRAYNAFVHAPYNLNLASKKEYVVEAAKMYLRDAAKYGFKGVVFHTGHKASKERGVEMMRHSLTEILKAATPDAPFILETPCGNNNELLATPEEFTDFLFEFPESLLGACMDTCHVFVSGYAPIDYLNRLGKGSERICLFHFNGSRKKMGCHADGHGHVTRPQNIPDDQLVGVLEKAEEWGVCSVTE